MTPEDLEALMRKYPEGCAGKYLKGGDRLRQEIDRSYAKVKQPSDEETIEADPDADGAVLLDDVYAFLARFVVYPSQEAHTAHTLWVAHTHFMDTWDSTPRLAFLSAEPESGKTRALEVSNLLVPNPVDAVNVSAAYLFRKVAADSPTVLFDEIDTVFCSRNGAAGNNEDIRGLLNAGHRRGATAGRCVVQGNTVMTEELPAYAAVALAGLGDLPDTILSRAIIVRMNRRAPGERVEPFRARLHTAAGHALRDRLVAWAKGARFTGWPILPNEVTDRAADCWEPLVAVADLAGGRWPATARTAAVFLVARLVGDRREASLGLRLLADMRTVLGNDEAKTTVAILDRLQKLDESPWADIRGKPLTDRGLAMRLRAYGIEPQDTKGRGRHAQRIPEGGLCGRLGPLPASHTLDEQNIQNIQNTPSIAALAMFWMFCFPGVWERGRPDASADMSTRQLHRPTLGVSRPEQTIHRTVVQHLQRRGAPGLVFIHVPNGGKRQPVEAAIFKGLGVRAGVPDLLLWHDAKSYALELKAKGGRTTEAQLQFLADMRNAGAFADVAVGLDAALRKLEGWGLLRGQAQ